MPADDGVQPLRVAILTAPQAARDSDVGTGGVARAITATMFGRGRLVVNVPPDEADVLVLIGAATGAWGGESVRTAAAFAHRVGPDRIIIVVDGAPTATASIAQIAGDELAAVFPTEPLWIDLRAAQDGGVTTIIRALDEERRRRRPATPAPTNDDRAADPRRDVRSEPAPEPAAAPAPAQAPDGAMRRGRVIGDEMQERPASGRSAARWLLVAGAVVLVLLVTSFSVLTMDDSGGGDTGDGDGSIRPLVAIVGGGLVVAVSLIAFWLGRRKPSPPRPHQGPAPVPSAPPPAPRRWPAPSPPASPPLDSSVEPPDRTDDRAVAFVSYATEDDQSMVQELVGWLRSVVEVWFAAADVGVGQQWLFEISDALETADFYVVVITRRSMSSPWVRQELSAAFRRSVESGTPHLVPVLAELCDYPILLGNFQMIDATVLSREQTRDRLVAVVG